MLRLISDGVMAECDIMGRGLKAQMKYADKRRAKTCLVIGDDELDKGYAVLRSMNSSNSLEVELETLSHSQIEEVISL